MGNTMTQSGGNIAWTFSVSPVLGFVSVFCSIFSTRKVQGYSRLRIFHPFLIVFSFPKSSNQASPAFPLSNLNQLRHDTYGNLFWRLCTDHTPHRAMNLIKPLTSIPFF